ncbi:hypothetical protein GYMLUDRAFT_44752 [Collybiopsis luxurians FD-317 M1]|uniref:F-box domain-containing protein n=1 Tax=Collybiopsis luxurians FD-317 M1 TaxID=944289 RepID=A0A0D0CAC0_9AGAR|nr:hypothetical protein GYMLUDRAFT_44752 [Collybiopsis luxurians FD-317 M1]
MITADSIEGTESESVPSEDHSNRLKIWDAAEELTSSVSLDLCDLPTELLLEILCLAGSISQATYRALLLTSKRIHELVRLECIPFLPILIFKKKQLESFCSWLFHNEPIANRVRYLWIVPDTSPRFSTHNLHLTAACMGFCPNIVSLACGAQELLCWERNLASFVSLPPKWPRFPIGHFRHPSLKHLTIMENCDWVPVGSRLFSQIETLHVIGCRSPEFTFPCQGSISYHYPNLLEATFSLPKKANVLRPDMQFLMRSPKLKRAAFVTRQRLEPLVATLFNDILNLTIGSRFALVHRPKRWTEMKMWQTKLADAECVWKLLRTQDQTEDVEVIDIPEH